jgi:hypothetical protein
MKPSREAFTTTEWRLIQRLNTPLKVQRWLNALPYNTEKGGGTQRSFRGVISAGMAHSGYRDMVCATWMKRFRTTTGG